MSCRVKCFLRLLLIGVLLILSVAPGFAAEVRRIPSKASVEQGFLALTLDAEGAEDFRYTGEENKTHMYRGTIQPGSKLKFTIRATLADQKSLPINGRSCIIRLKVVAKKGDEVLKTQNFSKENKSNVFVNYTVPEGADTLEVSEIFVLNNKSKEEKFNQKVTSLNKLILTTSDAAVAGTADKKTDEKDGEKKTDTDKDKNTDKKDNGNNAGSDKKNGSDSGTTKTSGDAKESKGISTKMLAGAVVALAAIGCGGFFYMKKSKEGRAKVEEIARKEKLRQQAIQRQQELQQQNLQRSQEERDQRSRMLEEKRMRMEEEALQQVQREEQQRLMQQQNTVQQQPGMTGAFVAGAAGVMGSVQNNAAENVQNNVPNAAPQFCINCGAPLKPGTKFCENCGAKV